MRSRDAAIDRLRGAVMVLMALDHARDFFGDTQRVPTDVATTTPALFATRWVTHFCAPVFVFLAGTAAWFYAEARTRRDAARFLLSRGLFLVLLELTVVRLGWHFDPTSSNFTLQVIWAIGWSMIVLAGLVRSPRWAIAPFGLAVVALHHLADGFAPRAASWLWSILHAPGRIGPFLGLRAYVVYPLVPWLGVIALGFAFGPLAARPPAERRPTLLRLGAGITLAFVALRAIDRYGDPSPWRAQGDAVRTVMSFLNTTKYPPSLSYLTMTLGPAIVALGLLSRARRDDRPDVLSLLGRVPLFFYVAHLYLLQLGAVVTGLVLRGRPSGAFDREGIALGLPWVYVAWLLVTALLLPACRAFAGFKSRHRGAWWVGYV